MQKLNKIKDDLILLVLKSQQLLPKDKSMNFKQKILLIVIMMALMMSAHGQISGSKAEPNNRLPNFQYVNPVFELTDEQLENKTRVLRFSTFTGHREGVAKISGITNYSSYVDRAQGTIRIYMHNLTIEEMLTKGFRNSSRIVLEVSDSSRYRYKESYGSFEKWLRENTYCFELLLPLEITDVKRKMEIVNEELSSFFKVKFFEEKRKVRSLVLIRLSDNVRLGSKGKGAPSFDNKGKLNGVELKVIGSLLYRAQMPPFFDETGFKDKVDMDLGISDWTDLTSVRKALANYGLDLREELREVNMFIIQEIN